MIKSVAQWTLVLKVYCILSETNAVSTLFLSAFFWAFLYSQARAVPIYCAQCRGCVHS